MQARTVPFAMALGRLGRVFFRLLESSGYIGSVWKTALESLGETIARLNENTEHFKNIWMAKGVLKTLMKGFLERYQCIGVMATLHFDGFCCVEGVSMHPKSESRT